MCGFGLLFAVVSYKLLSIHEASYLKSVTFSVILGGTIDIVVHKIMEDKTLAEVYKASGGDWGGNIVDAEFKAFVTGLFKNEQCIDKLWEIAPRDALDFEREFEAKKRQISCNTSLDDIRLQIPNRL